MNPVSACIAWIVMCLIGTIIIEVAALYRRVMALELVDDTCCAQCGSKQSNSDNREQTKIQHQVISFDDRRKQLRA